MGQMEGNKHDDFQVPKRNREREEYNSLGQVKHKKQSLALSKVTDIRKRK